MFHVELNEAFKIGARMDNERRQILDRVRAEAERLRMSWPGGLADELEVKHQTVNHWRTRGIPPAMYDRVAAVLGWSVDQLLGKAPAAARVGWPFPNIPEHRYRRLKASQQLIVEAAILDALSQIEAGAGPTSGPRRRHPRSRAA